MSRQTSSFVTSMMCGAALALALAGCGEEPTPPRLISFSPAALTVPGGEALAISVEYEENDFALQDFQWSVEAGEIEHNGAPSITYHAPADPGDYKVTVAVAYGDDDAALSLDAVIKVTEPAGTSAPPVAEASEAATSSSTVAGQPVEQATVGTGDEPTTPAAPTAREAVEEATTAGQAAPESTVTEEVEATTAAPAEAAATAAGEAVEETEGATEEAPPPAATEQARATAAAPAVEATPEQPAAEPVEAIEEATTAVEGAAARAGTEVEKGAEEAAEAVEETASAVTRDVAALAEQAKGGGEGPAQQPEAPTGGATATTDEPPAAPAPEPTVAALTAPAAATAAAAGSRLDQMLDRHRLTAVVQIALKPFSFYGEDGRRTGFEIDLMREFARRWLDDPTAITFLPVPPDARISTLQKGRADLIGAALTKTPARAEEVDFSLTYFKDGQQLLVPQSSAVADVCDLKGRKVAAIHGSTSLDNLKAAAAKCGFEPGADLVTFRRHDDAIEALLEGQVEAYTSDGVALASATEGRPLKVVGNHFSEEPYGFAVPKGDRRLLELINHTLEEMERDGTYAAIYQKWFADTIRPYPLEESETVAATEVAALATTSAPPIVEPKTGSAGPVETYVVQAGDTLSRIAGKVYGDVSPKSWERIWQANRDVIGDDPSRIQAGMSLAIPQ